MSVDNFDGDGYADQPSIIYGFEDEDDLEIRELARAGFGQPGTSPGDVIQRDSTKSSLTDRLPDLDLPGQEGLARDDCGDDIPAFACLEDDGCGQPVYVGRTCASPVCERDWPAAVKDKVTRYAGKLEGLRRALYARYDGSKEIDFNHVIASLPSIHLDSTEPTERVLLILKTFLEKEWGVDGFAAIYHPYRIKKEYRKDQYEHGGEPGEGEMTWKDILGKDDPHQYIKFEPHFHLFFPAIRRSFDYLVAEAVEEKSGWLFHRITKGKDSNVSVEDLDDLVHQLTYCLSHAGVQERGGRMELATRMKGDLQNCYIPDGVLDETLAIFTDAAPRLLGVRFANMQNATCDAEISDSDWSADDEDETVDESEPSRRDRHPIEDLYDHAERRSRSGGADPRSLDATAPLEDGRDEAGDGLWSSGASSASPSTATPTAPSESAAESSPVEDARETCGGSLKPIHEAGERLEDEGWCQQAQYVGGLRAAFEEWRHRTGGDEELPWLDEDGRVIEPD